MKKVIGLVLAGGIGSRMGENIPKQYLEILGKPILVYAIEPLEKSDKIDDIYVVCANKWKNYVAELCAKYKISKFKGTFLGGETGLESIWNGFDGIKTKNYSSDSIIVIQDGNRCLVTKDIIDDGIRVCLKKHSAISALPQVCDQVAQVPLKKECFISRTGIYELLRPEYFTIKKLLGIEEKYYKGDYKSQNPTCLMLEMGEQINLSKGNSLNFKITFKEDLVLLKAALTILNKN